jgi:CheY-like chemotaxis protein
MDTSRALRRTTRVLAVDDSEEMLILVQASLERYGYSVHAVDCGEDAIEAATREVFDLVVLDVDMPGLDGLAVGRALRENPSTRVAMIAMHTSLEEAQVRHGFDGYDLYLHKPCSPLLLGERLDRLLQGRITQREMASDASCVD